MRYFSTNNKEHIVSAKEAVLSGLAPDGGLYMPETIPSFEQQDIESLSEKSLHEIALLVAKPFLKDDVPESVLKEIISEAFNFPLPLVKLDERVSVLELFHGPTLAFKDLAARFMARLLAYFKSPGEQETSILVATSGDTGGAVAHGFFNVPGFRVIILYPKGQVSFLQEKQLTTLGGNITSFEVSGNFDDCQRMAKEAFVDPECREQLKLASANSINIARLIPQAFYYAYVSAQISKNKKEVVFSVPSGNLGNVTAGLIAKKMGAPISRFVISTNANQVVPEYLRTGEFKPSRTINTISNAMDIGNPSNFARLSEMFGHSLDLVRADIDSFSFSDEETKSAMREVENNFSYTMDPHGAVGYLGLRKFFELRPDFNGKGIVIETAHPAKFLETVEETLGKTLDLPQALADLKNKTKVAKEIKPELDALKREIL